MILSMESYSIVKRLGEEKAFELLKRIGFDACDYSFYYEGTDLLGDDYLENAKRTKKNLDKAGLLCNQAHAPFELSEGEPFDLSCPNYLLNVRSIEYAAYIGAKNIIVHFIYTQNREDLYAYNQKYFKSLEPYAKKFGIKIAVENDFERRDGKKLPLPDSCEQYVSFINDLASDSFVSCIDVGHASMFYDPAEFIEKTGGALVKALHVHDNDLDEDKHMFPMTGDINWNALCDALKKTNYSGDFTLEVIKGFYKIPDELLEDALVFLEKIGRYLIKKVEG